MSEASLILIKAISIALVFIGIVGAVQVNNPAIAEIVFAPLIFIGVLGLALTKEGK